MVVRRAPGNRNGDLLRLKRTGGLQGRADNDVFQLLYLLFGEVLKLDPAFSHPEFFNKVSGQCFAAQYFYADSLGPEFMLPAVDINFGRLSDPALVGVETHTGQSAHAEINDGANYF